VYSSLGTAESLLGITLLPTSWSLTPDPRYISQFVIWILPRLRKLRP
jgi:hypothetical protein